MNRRNRNMTDALYQQDAYLGHCPARVIEHDLEGLVLDRTVFYPVGGGQPGDVGWLEWKDGGRLQITGTRRRDDGEILHLADTDQVWPTPGSDVEARLDWELRYRHMRMHTCMHLLGMVIPHGVTGGNIGAQRSRLDFDMEETVDKEDATARLNELIQADLPVSSQWITEEELDRQPELVRTLSVSPPRGAGRIRLLNIGDKDLQPCGGTHVRHTGEIIGALVVKTEKKGKRNRRVHISLTE
jgi:misacylated tRNA(Ala) deacylase